MYITSKVTIGQKTQCAGHLDRIVKQPGRDIGLPDHRDARVGSADKTYLPLQRALPADGFRPSLPAGRPLERQQEGISLYRCDNSCRTNLSVELRLPLDS
jgi:hypothetical protein